MRLVAVLVCLVAGAASAQEVRVIFSASEPYVPKIAVDGKSRWLPLDIHGWGETPVDVPALGVGSRGPNGVSLRSLLREEGAIYVDFIHGRLLRGSWNALLYELENQDRRVDADALTGEMLRRCTLLIDDRRVLARCSGERSAVRDATWSWCGTNMCVHLHPDGTVTRTGSQPSDEEFEEAERSLDARRRFLDLVRQVDGIWADRSLGVADRLAELRALRRGIATPDDPFLADAAAAARRLLDKFLDSHTPR